MPFPINFFCFFQNERPTNSVGTKDSVQGTNGNEGYQGSKWSCEELTQQKAWQPHDCKRPSSSDAANASSIAIVVFLFKMSAQPIA